MLKPERISVIMKIYQKNRETEEKNMEEIINEMSGGESTTETVDEKGNVKIAVDVVATIAGIAANEIEGVAGMCGNLAGGIAEFLGNKKNPTKGVKVDMKEDSAVIDLFIVAEYGIRIPELAWEIQENVKNSVESMTGITVEKVNIHVDGISFEKEKNKEKEKNEEQTEEIILDDLEEIEEIPEEGSEGL